MSEDKLAWTIDVHYVIRTEDGKEVQLSSKEKAVFQRDCEASVLKLVQNRLGLGPIDQEPYYCQCEDADCPAKK